MQPPGEPRRVWTVSQLLPQQLLHNAGRREAVPREGTFREPKAGTSILQRKPCMGGRLPGFHQAPPRQRDQRYQSRGPERPLSH